MLGAPFWVLAISVTPVFCHTFSDRRAAENGLTSISESFPYAPLHPRGTQNATSSSPVQNSPGYFVVVPRCNEIQCLLPRYDSYTPARRKGTDLASDDRPQGEPEAKRPRLGANDGVSSQTSGSSSSSSDSPAMTGSFPHPWSRLSVPGNGANNFAEASLHTLNRTQWYLRAVPNLNSLRGSSSTYNVRANLTYLLPDPRLGGLIRQTIEDYSTSPFNLYQIITPQRLLQMYDDNSYVDQRSRYHFPQWARQMGSEIRDNLVTNPPLLVRQILGDPFQNSIALDARMAFLFESILLNVTRVDHRLDLMGAEARGSTQLQFIQGRLADDLGYPPEDRRYLPAINPRAMTVEEAFQLLELFERCINPHSSVWRAANTTVQRLARAIRTIYHSDNVHDTDNGPNTGGSLFYMRIFHPMRRTSLWEYVMLRFMPSFRLAYMLLDATLQESQERLNRHAQHRFAPSGNHTLDRYLLQGDALTEPGGYEVESDPEGETVDRQELSDVSEYPDSDSDGESVGN